MKKSILILTVAVLGANAFAESSADLAPDIYNRAPTNTPSPTPTTQFPTLNPQPTPTPVVAPLPVSTGSINPAANTGKKSQDSGSGANTAIGAALMAAGMAMMANPPTQPQGAILMALGALALAQGSHDSGAADQSAATAGASYNQVGTNNATTNPALGTGSSAYTNPALSKGTAALKEAGYKLTSAGLTTPSGVTIPNSALSSASGMASAGLDAGAISDVQKTLASAIADSADKMKVSGVGLAASDGSPTGAAGGGTTGGDYSFSNRRSGFGLSDADKKKLVAGKTVNFDGEPIGVRGQNIFDMIHVAYQKKKDNKDFLGDDGAAAGGSLRSPASMGSARPASLPRVMTPAAKPLPKH